MDAPGGLHGRYATFTSEDQSRLDWMDNQLSDTTHEEFVQGSSNDADWEDVAASDDEEVGGEDILQEALRARRKAEDEERAKM